MQALTTPEALDRAWFLFQNNRFELAEQELRKYLSENPDNAPAHILLARCLFELSCHAEAIESAKKGIELAPNHHYPYWVLGYLYVRLQQLDLAEEYLLNAIELDPEQAYCYASLSELYWYRGSARNLKDEQRTEIFQKGIEVARTGLELDSEHANSLLYLIRNLLGVGDNSCLSEAIDLSENLLSLEPGSAASHEVYARALTVKAAKTKKKQDLNRILKIIEESLRLDPNYAYVKNLSHDLLMGHFRVINIPQELQYSSLRIIPLATPLLLIVAFCFYNTLGFEFITIIPAIATLISLSPWVDTTQSFLRAWLNPYYRKFLMPEPVIYLFWLVFAIITVIGVSWKLMSISLFNFFYILILIFVGGGGLICMSITLFQETKSHKTFFFYIFLAIIGVICGNVLTGRKSIDKNKQPNRVATEIRLHSILHESIKTNALK